MEVSHAGFSSVFAGNSTSCAALQKILRLKLRRSLPVLTAFFPVLTAFSPYLRRRFLTLSRVTQGGSKNCHNMSQAIA